MASQFEYPLISVDEFLKMDFGDRKAELDDGVIRMMAGGRRRHARVQANVIAALGPRLRGSGCAAYTSDMAARTGERTIRYPDVSIYCGHEDGDDDEETWSDDPRVVFEILSAGTARTDLRVKLPEYQALRSIDTVVFVDTVTERLRIVQRTGPAGWSDISYQQPIDLALPSIGVTIPHDEIFARD